MDEDNNFGMDGRLVSLSPCALAGRDYFSKSILEGRLVLLGQNATFRLAL